MVLELRYGLVMGSQDWGQGYVSGMKIWARNGITGFGTGTWCWGKGDRLGTELWG